MEHLKRPRSLNEGNKKKLKTVFRQVRPKDDRGWEDVARMMGSKFAVGYLKEQCQGMRLKTRSSSLYSEEVRKTLKKLKETMTENKTPRKGSKAAKDVKQLFQHLAALTYQERQPEISDAKKEEEENDEDAFIHEAFTSPLTEPVEPTYYQQAKYKFNTRMWCPTILKPKFEDVGDDFETPVKSDTAYRDIYASSQIRPKSFKKS